MNARYAVYYIPEPETALARLGSALLGRDSETGHNVAQPVFAGLSQERLHTLTDGARRYGLHATLKAPFFLKPGMPERELLLAATHFAVDRKAIILPRLQLARLGSFFAFVPSEGSPKERQILHRVNVFAADVVTFFDHFRAAPTEQETARRNPHTLSVRQRALLADWGYPYVFDEYRFHITLTDCLRSSTEAQAMGENLGAYFVKIGNENMVIASICICKQILDDSICEFTLLKRFHLQRF